jgi:hypothetical protein
MDEIIKLVQEKVGLSEDQAKAAVTTVLGFVSGDTGGLAGQAESVMGMLGGLMGKK